MYISGILLARKVLGNVDHLVRVTAASGEATMLIFALYAWPRGHVPHH